MGRIRIAAALTAALLILLTSTAGRAAILGPYLATFENYAEGSLGTAPFTDPISGIRFSDATAANHNFVIEGTTIAYPALPSITPGHYLKSNGLSGGDGISGSPNTGFTMTLPTLAASIAMDIVYASPGSLQVDAYDTSNVLVATMTLTPPAGFFREAHLSLQSPAAGIHHFKTISTLSAIGYDNVAYTPIPEPATTAAIVTGLILVTCGRARRRGVLNTEGGHRYSRANHR